MKKLLFAFIFVMFLMSFASARYEYNDGTTGGTTNPTSTNWRGQNLTIGTIGSNENILINKISFRGYKTDVGRTGIYDFAIRSSLTGDDLTNGTLDVSTLATGTGASDATFFNVTLSPAYQLSASGMYYIVIRSRGVADDNLTLTLSTTSTYAGGVRVFSSDGGATWSGNTAQDHYFEIFGNPANLVSTTLNSPSTGLTTTSPTLLFNASATASTSLTNMTLFVWNSSNYIINQSTTLISGTINTTTWNVNSFNLDAYNWNVLSCSSSNCTYATTNNTFNWGYVLNSATYSSVVAETSVQNYSLNLTIANIYTSGINYLNYNGTNYLSTITNDGLNTILTNIITVPEVNATKDVNFNWNISIVNSLGGITNLIVMPSNQTISSLLLIYCNNTYKTVALNFTFYDELTQTPIDATLNKTNILLNFKYWLGEGLIKKTYAFQQLDSANNSFAFCIFPNSTLYLDMDLQYYSANGYADRSFYLRNYSITNSLQNIRLYSLATTEATKFKTTLKQGTDLFNGAIVNIYKYFVGLGQYQLIMVGLTDDKGSFSANLDLDQTYNFSIVRDGVNYGSISKQSTCTASPCEIDLNIGSEIINPFDSLTNYIAQNVAYNLTYNDTTKTVNLTFFDKTGTSQYWRLWVYQSNYGNDTTITICDTKVYSSSGNIGCDYTNRTGDISAKVYISRSPEKPVAFINFVNDNATQILGATGILASIIIILVIVFAGTRNPVNALILIPFALVILKFIGFLPLSWTWLVGLTIFDIWIIGRMNT